MRRGHGAHDDFVLILQIGFRHVRFVQDADGQFYGDFVHRFGRNFDPAVDRVLSPNNDRNDFPFRVVNRLRCLAFGKMEIVRLLRGRA